MPASQRLKLTGKTSGRMVGYPEVTPKSGRRCLARDKYPFPQLGNIVLGAFAPVLAKRTKHLSLVDKQEALTVQWGSR